MYESGLGAVIWLQSNLSWLQPLFLWFSHLGDPRNAFLLIFPICYGLNKKVGIKCLWIASLTEWLNAVLKWIFRDDRPYWYTRSHLQSSSRMLMQFPITCETGPGFPSGHVMSICAVGLLVVLELNICVSRILFKVILSIIFFIIVTMVAISRIYIATHFPHQVFFAIFIGAYITIMITKFSKKLDLSHVKLCIFAPMGMLLSAVFLHQALVWLQLDPSSTVLLATRWCEKQNWVHLDTTPFYAIVRDSAVLLGLGLGEYLNDYFALPPCDMKVIHIVANLTFLYVLEKVKLFQQSQLIFYGLAFLKFMFVSLTVTLSPFLPLLINRIIVSSTDKYE